MPASSLHPRVRERSKDPVFWTDVIQLVKTVAAAVLAWIIATSVLDLPQSFLAPWSALLVVHATVYRTFSQGVRQVGAAVLGVVVAWAVGNTMGIDPLAVAVALMLGLVLGSIPWFADEATTIAATALIVLTTGFSDNDFLLLSRLADTAIGIAVGLLVNLTVWPPLRRRTAISAMDALDDKIGQLLIDMGEGLATGYSAEDVEEWIDRTRSLDEDLDDAWAYVRQARESARMNPRRSAGELKDPQRWMDLLRRMEQALAETRSMARTLGHALRADQSWDPEFRQGYIAVLHEGGSGIVRAERERIAAARARLDELVDLLNERSPISRLWPVYGGLIINLRNILDSMDEVAGANPLQQPPLPFRRPRP
jgi:uncharacterized membrane protein YgaE (UPF0421/DUF939 family)